ncbi:VanZ like family protein [Flavobacterium fluvii]|uniref:VanZ like family protein n=1 Tax=Flavobacterium fluvii TaxID=468056 RepID=A0A1M5DWW0_9FLAO|nr:VanZ like family protein [Flavobacterium fluvii]
MAALFWSGVILFFCLIKSNDIPTINVPYVDKAVHAVFHFVFTLLWFLFFKKKLDTSNIFRPLVISFVFSFFFGVAIELMQKFFTTTRSADVIDELANLSGAALAVIAIVSLDTYKGVMDRI